MWANLKRQREYCIPESPSREKNSARILSLSFPSSNSFLLSGYSSLHKMFGSRVGMAENCSQKGNSCSGVCKHHYTDTKTGNGIYTGQMQLRFNRAEPGILILCLWPSWGIHFQGCGISDTVVGTALHSCESNRAGMSSVSARRRDRVSSISPVVPGTDSRRKKIRNALRNRGAG